MTALLSRIKIVQSFEELVATPFADGVNALCWRRELAGDFAEIAERLGPLASIEPLDEDALAGLSLSPAGQAARSILVADLRRLREAGLDPSLDCIPSYPRDEDSGPFPVDVYSFHADSAPVIADTYLCSYASAASEGLPNEHAVRRIDIPETRAELLRLFGGSEGEPFEAFLADHCYDLHYAPLPNAAIYSFGFGHLWRIANRCPGSPVPPCIHRAPATERGQAPRLLLIS